MKSLGRMSGPYILFSLAKPEGVIHAERGCAYGDGGEVDFWMFQSRTVFGLFSLVLSAQLCFP